MIINVRGCVIIIICIWYFMSISICFNVWNWDKELYKIFIYENFFINEDF